MRRKSGIRRASNVTDLGRWRVAVDHAALPSDSCEPDRFSTKFRSSTKGEDFAEWNCRAHRHFDWMAAALS